jgi:hypothetical protein
VQWIFQGRRRKSVITHWLRIPTIAASTQKVLPFDSYNTTPRTIEGPASCGQPPRHLTPLSDIFASRIERSERPAECNGSRLEESGLVVAGCDNFYSVALAAGCVQLHGVRRSRIRLSWLSQKSS